MNLADARKRIEALEGAERREAEQLLAQLVESYEDNPLLRFHACEKDCGQPGCVVHPKQREFLLASTAIQAAFAGNRFGKTTALTVKCFVQHIPREDLPERLKPFKHVDRERVRGRLLCPTDQVFESVNMEVLRQWAPKQYLRKGSFDRAWDKQHRILHFEDGGQLQVFTYKQEPSTMGGTALDYVAYDEPPPEPVRRENLMRLVDRDGCEIYALTPVNMAGGGIGWLWREIWRRREAPHITVVNGSIHDNPLLSPSKIAQVLAEYSDDERRAREHGEFVHFGGMVFPGGFEQVLADPPDPAILKDQDIVVGIDPGLRNAAFVWGAFDRDNRCLIFDEVLLQNSTADVYAKRIFETNLKWGIERPLYVIDPSARNRTLIHNRESVLTEIQRQGIYPILGQNDIFAGCMLMLRRMKEGAFFISKALRHIRDEAELYRLEDRPDGEFKPVREDREHFIDGCRYLVMSRSWTPHRDVELTKPLGIEALDQGRTPSVEWLRSQTSITAVPY